MSSNTVLTASATRKTIGPAVKNLFKEVVNVGEAVINILSATGIAGFKFHIPQYEMVDMQNDVTDNYLDNNRPAHDHIVQKPLQLTMKGMQGEYFYSVNEISDTLALVVPTLSLIKEIIPKFYPAEVQQSVQKANSVSGLTLKDKVKNFFSEEFNYFKQFNSLDLFKLFQDLYKIKSAQTRAFMFLEALWKSQAIFSVETSWKRYDNMVILSLKPVRDNNADITEFDVTFKQLSFTESLVTPAKNEAGRVDQQTQEEAKKGKDKGEKKDV